MTGLNNQPTLAPQDKELIRFLRTEITSLKSQLKKKDDWVATQDVMLKQIAESHSAEAGAYEDLEGKLEDVIDTLRKRVPHGDILDFLKINDSQMRQY